MRDGDGSTAGKKLLRGVTEGGGGFLRRVQKDSPLLRPSRHEYVCETLRSAVRRVLKADGVPEDVREYFCTLDYLYRLAKDVRTDFERVVAWLEQHREAGVKTALAVCDWLFLKQSLNSHAHDTEDHGSRELDFWSAEEWAAGASTLLAIHRDRFGPLRENPTLISDPLGEEAAILPTLLRVCHLVQFREWELRIDRLGYRFSQADGEPSVLRLAHPDPHVERAERLGFIRAEQQARNAVLRELAAGTAQPLLSTYAHRTAAMLQENGFVERRIEPAERIVFGLPDLGPDGPANPLLTPVLGEGYFQDEMIWLKAACRDLLCDGGKLLDFTIPGRPSLKEAVRLWRLYRYLALIQRSVLIPRVEREPGVVLQSLLPAANADVIVKLAARVVGEESATRLLEMWEAPQSGRIDLQYRPFVRFGDTLLTLPNVLGGANVVRNYMADATGRGNHTGRLYSDGSDSPDERGLRDALRDAGVAAASGVKYAGGGVKGEVDVLAVAGPLAVALECKNALLPADTHELVKDWDHVTKASGQLSRLADRFPDQGFRKRLGQASGLPVEDCTELVTGIVLVNRMYAGLRTGGHAVRGYHETLNLIESGKVVFGSEDVSHWRSETFALTDLAQFLRGDATYTDTWAGMDPFEERYQIGNSQVLLNRFRLDVRKVVRAAGFGDLAEEMEREAAAANRGAGPSSLAEALQRVIELPKEEAATPASKS